MSDEFAREHNFKINKSYINVKVTDGRSVQVIGITVPLMIEIRGHQCKLQFLVFLHKEHDILLGLDYFIKTGLGIFPKQGLFMFPDEDIIIANTLEAEYSINMIEELDEEDDETAELLLDWEAKSLNIKPMTPLPRDSGEIR